MRFYDDFRQQLELLRFNGFYLYRSITNNDTHFFTRIFEDNGWGTEESRSGPGSTLEYTERLRAELPAWTRKYGIRSLFDAPCGDFNWFQAIALDDSVQYLGGDLVPAIIASNQARYGSAQHRFVCHDIVQDKLPQVDLWFCRDLWFHLSFCQIAMSLQQFLDSDVRYLATTTHYRAPFNFDIPAGGFRMLNLRKAPFHFPAPIDTIEDWIPGHQIRHIGLWSRESLEPLRPRIAELLVCRPKNFRWKI